MVELGSRLIDETLADSDICYSIDALSLYQAMAAFAKQQNKRSFFKIDASPSSNSSVTSFEIGRAFTKYSLVLPCLLGSEWNIHQILLVIIEVLCYHTIIYTQTPEVSRVEALAFMRDTSDRVSLGKFVYILSYYLTLFPGRGFTFPNRLSYDLFNEYEELGFKR